MDLSSHAIEERLATTCLDDIQEREEVDSIADSDFEDNELDPRIKVELENLNIASNAINGLELDLDEARSFFHQCLGEATRTLRVIADRLGNSVDKARPYFEAVLQAREAKQFCQDAATKYEKACNENRGAREAIRIAEQKVVQHPGTFDAAWQEMLNHADMKQKIDPILECHVGTLDIFFDEQWFVEAERQKEKSNREHQEACLAYSELEARATALEKKLKKAIGKARPYFENRSKHQEYLQEQKRRIKDLETSYASAKESYAQALKNLEKISEEIHEKRKELEKNRSVVLEPRQQGVGAEAADQEEEALREREKLLLSRKEERLKRILNVKRPLTRAALRSSLCLELGLDFDIKDVLASPQSPSSKSIDLGDIFSQSFEDYEVLDITRYDPSKRRNNFRRSKSQTSDS